MEVSAAIEAKLPPLCIKLFQAKRRTNLTFVEIAKRMRRSEVWVAAVFYGQARLSLEDLKRIVAIFDAEGELSLHDIVPREVEKYFPDRGLLTDVLPADPTLNRLGEILKVYGHPIKAIINEKFGDGIISAVDCTVDVDKESNVGGDRVKLTISGKFLAYKQCTCACLKMH